MKNVILSGCIIEYDISYKHNNVNNGPEDLQPDMESCRSFCKTKNVPYFEYVKPGSSQLNDRYQGSCWCVASKSGRVEQIGSVSGDTNCLKGKELLR